MTETEIQREILDYLSMIQGVFAWRSSNHAVYDPRSGRFRRNPYALRGQPDILGILRPQGRMLAIEVKSMNGKLSIEQQQVLDKLTGMGALAFVARSTMDVVKRFREEGIIQAHARQSIPVPS